MEATTNKHTTTDHEYLQMVRDLEPDYAEVEARIAAEPKKLLRLLHAAMGKVTEAAEAVDQLKKVLFYGAPLDRVNLIEEAGDLEWYNAVERDELGVTREEVLGANRRKLAKRYGGKFDADKAANRDLTAERKALESNTVNVNALTAEDLAECKAEIMAAIDRAIGGCPQAVAE